MKSVRWVLLALLLAGCGWDLSLRYYPHDGRAEADAASWLEQPPPIDESLSDDAPSVEASPPADADGNVGDSDDASRVPDVVVPTGDASACPAGQAHCGAACRPVLYTDEHCGPCDVACTGGAFCVNTSRGATCCTSLHGASCSTCSSTDFCAGDNVACCIAPR